MKKATKSILKPLVTSIAAVLILAYLSGKSMGSHSHMWYMGLCKSQLTPPSFIFPIVWTLLYIMIGTSLGILVSKLKKSKKPLKYFFIQLGLNFLWSPLFFGLQSPLLGFLFVLPLWAMILQNIIYYRRYSKWASYLLIPYFIWVSFAVYLSSFIFFHNPMMCN